MGIFDNLFVWKVQNPPDASRAPTQKQLREMNSELGLLNGAMVNNKIFTKEEYEAYHKGNPGAKVETENARITKEKYAALKENLKEKVTAFKKDKEEQEIADAELAKKEALSKDQDPNRIDENIDKGQEPVTKDKYAALREEHNIVLDDLQEENNKFRGLFDAYNTQDTNKDFQETLENHGDLRSSYDAKTTLEHKEWEVRTETEIHQEKLENDSEKFKHDFDVSASPDAPKQVDIERDI